MGMKSPSSYTSRASAERTWPPISAEWQVEAKKAMRSPPRKTGLQMVTSLRWPDVFHGSLVMTTSPGSHASTGYTSRTCFMARAMELMCPGVPVTACATIQPRRSKTPADRSPASRTMDVKDVRISAAACSFTTPISRFQQMSRVIGSNSISALASNISSAP